MTTFVVDASVAAEYLLRTNLGIKAAASIDGALLVAPELLDVEVMSVLRRAVLHKRLGDERALLALEDLIHWHVDRIAHSDLITVAWRYRHNVSAYDAFYVAAALLYDAPLVTSDGPLSRAVVPGIIIENIRPG